MEQQKLLDWARIVNLTESDETLSVGLRLSRHTVIDVMHQIESLLLDLGKMKERYRIVLVVDETELTGQPRLDDAPRSVSRAIRPVYKL